MICPRCGDEYTPGHTRCVDCDVALIEPGTDVPPPPPQADALLGRFHPAVADALEELLERRGIAHERFELDDAAELLVDGDWRGDLRAELVVNWSDVVGNLAEDKLYEVMAEGGNLPGWRDAPAGAWVDREGRLQVGEAAEEEAVADAQRRIGPALVAGGTVLLLLAWYSDAGLGGVLVLAGLAAIGFGVFLPR